MLSASASRLERERADEAAVGGGGRFVRGSEANEEAGERGGRRGRGRRKGHGTLDLIGGGDEHFGLRESLAAVDRAAAEAEVEHARIGKAADYLRRLVCTGPHLLCSLGDIRLG